MDPFPLLALVEGCGPGLISALLDPASDPERLLRMPPLGLPPRARKVLDRGLPQLRAQAEEIAGRASSQGMQILTPRSGPYPERLRPTPLRPLQLFAQGEPALASDLSRTSVAVVGSRTPTPYGEGAAWAFCRALAGAGVVLWSGLARGIDGIAHRACLEAGTPTVAVLAGGLDQVYPAEHRELWRAILSAGGLGLSESPPGQRATRGHFPRRNRILASGADAVLVVEAGLASGSLHTARFAADAGVPVFALPGPWSSPRSRGCHQLLAEGAGVAADPEELLRELGVTRALAGSSSGSEHAADQAAILACIRLGPRPADLVARESGLPEERFLEALLELREQGSVLHGEGDLISLSGTKPRT